MSIGLWAQEAVFTHVNVDWIVGTGYIHVMYPG